MIGQLVIGSLVIALTVVVEVTFIGLADLTIRRFSRWLTRPPFHLKTALVIAAVTIWLMLAHSVGVWLWAATFLILDAFQALEPALYFSVVAFTTLGFGDIILPLEWRLLSGLAAANGLLIFGFSTAVLIELLLRLRRAQSRPFSDELG